jgi:hypothetical protein
LNDHVVVLDEPLLEFRYGQYVEDPHDGLGLFGPYGVDVSVHPKSIALGVIGTPEGIEKFLTWCNVAQGPILSPAHANPYLWPAFPGFEAAFQSTLSTEAPRLSELRPEDLTAACEELDPNRRAFEVVELYLSRIALTEKREEPFGALVCVVPDLVWRNCRPESYVPGGSGCRISKSERDLRAAGQMDFFDAYDPEIYRYSVDFRRQIKARAMRFRVPIQIVRDSTLSFGDTLRGGRLSPPSDVAWNLSTTLYYKAGGKPWRLASARSGVCYIGIAFRRTDPSIGSPSACCAAQMFLDSGDGIVFLGQYGPWYSPARKQFHLAPEAAQELLRGVLKTYEELEGPPLNEIFLHCRSGISTEEFEGFEKGCPAGVKLVGIRVRKEWHGVRMYREGTRPAIRGSFCAPSGRLGYLWASGFTARLRTYPGWEVPVPLSIEVQHGDADITQVARDILALTKLNYNACRLGDSEPVTIGFSDSVGEILVSNRSVKERSPKFKFYI